MRVFIISSLLGALAAVTAVQAQHIGDIRQGRQLALDVCASCHAVRAGQTQSPLATAPSFEEIANTPGMTAAALNFALTAEVHPAMPLLMLSSQQVGDVSAYIFELAHQALDVGDEGCKVPYACRRAAARQVCVCQLSKHIRTVRNADGFSGDTEVEGTAHGLPAARRFPM